MIANLLVGFAGLTVVTFFGAQVLKGFLPEFTLRCVLLLYPAGDARRKEHIATMEFLPRKERPAFVGEQFAVALFDGLPLRFQRWRIDRSRPKSDSSLATALQQVLVAVDATRASGQEAEHLLGRIRSAMNNSRPPEEVAELVAKHDELVQLRQRHVHALAELQEILGEPLTPRKLTAEERALLMEVFAKTQDDPLLAD